MNLLPVLSIVVFALGSSLVSSAQTQSSAPVHTIAAITFSAAVMQTNEAQREFSQLRSKFTSRETHLKALHEEIDSLKKQLNAAADKLSEEEKATRLKAIENEEKQLDRETEDYRNDSQAESQEIFGKIAQKVYAFLQDYSQQHGYTVVLERGSTENPIVWYAAKTSDITDAVVQAYNAKTAASAPSDSKAVPRHE